MRVLFAGMVVLQFFGFSERCWSQTTNPVPAVGIKVSNVTPTGLVTGNQNNTVKADVVVSGLPDGNYNVTIVVYAYNANGNSSKTTTGTVAISGGKGTVNISAAFPTPMAAGDTGEVYVEVGDPSSGTSGTETSDITYR